ncbi:hypothetical protein ACLB1M_12445 [Escherichia coli]
MQHKLLINGELVSGEGEKQPVYNPATGDVFTGDCRTTRRAGRCCCARQMQRPIRGQTTPKVHPGMSAETG